MPNGQGRACLEHNQQRETDRVRQERFVFGIGRLPAARDCLGQALVSARLSRSHASCTASSASPGEPSIR